MVLRAPDSVAGLAARQRQLIKDMGKVNVGRVRYMCVGIKCIVYSAHITVEAAREASAPAKRILSPTGT